MYSDGSCCSSVLVSQYSMGIFTQELKKKDLKIALIQYLYKKI